MKKLEELLTPTQEELFEILRKTFKGKRVYYCEGNFILVVGNAPTLLVAHLDTVHEEPVKTICHSEDGNILMSPQGIGGDDRCGVYALCKVYEMSKIKPSILFTCDEEIGGIGANEFCKAHSEKKLPSEVDNLKLIIEIDRKGKNDAVYYDCDNPKFEEYITGKGFETAKGSFSDISVIAPELLTAAVNLSSGYYNAHTQHEFINCSELEKTVKKVLEIVEESAKKDFPKFEYIERKFFNIFSYGKFQADEFSKDEYAKINLLDDLPEEYQGYYQDIFEGFTSSEIADYKTLYKNNWAKKIVADIQDFYSYCNYNDHESYFDDFDDEK